MFNFEFELDREAGLYFLVDKATGSRVNGLEGFSDVIGGRSNDYFYDVMRVQAQDGLWYFISAETGEMYGEGYLSFFSHDEAGDNGTYAVTRQDGLEYFVNIRGEVISRPFSKINSEFKNGFATCKEGEYVYLISDKTFDIVGDGYLDIGRIRNNNLINVDKKDGKSCFIDNSLTQVSRDFLFVCEFTEGDYDKRQGCIMVQEIEDGLYYWVDEKSLEHVTEGFQTQTECFNACDTLVNPQYVASPLKQFKDGVIGLYDMPDDAFLGYSGFMLYGAIIARRNREVERCNGDEEKIAQVDARIKQMEDYVHNRQQEILNERCM